LDSVDYAICVLPVLAALDVVSTLYVASLGVSLFYYEAGFFARLAVISGLIGVYAVVYVLIVVGFAYFLWRVKNRMLSPLDFGDKLLFLSLVGAVCYMYITLAVAVIGNFFLPHIVRRGVSVFSFNALVYFGSALGLFLFLYGDVVAWLRGDIKHEQGRRPQNL